MKKLICALLCACFILSLAACQTGAPGGTLPTPTVPSQPVGPIEVPPLNMVSVSLPLIHEPTLASDGTELFRFTFQDVALNIPNADVAKAITLDLLQRMDSNSSEAVNLEKQAKAAYTPGADWKTYYYETLYTPTRMDETVLSLYGKHNSYDGIMQTTIPASATYDLITGKYLAISDILSETEGSSDSLCAKLIAKLDAIATDKSLFPTYKMTIESSFSMDLNRYYNWYFTQEGICFYFAPYEIAPNSAGTIAVTVPYSELAGLLNDAYFPAEQPNMAATLSAGWFEQADLTQFDQFAELLSHPDAKRSVIWVDTVVYDFRLDQGYWDTESNQFVAEATVFTANCLVKGDLLMLRHELDATPTLRLRYLSDGAEQIRYITKDATSGDVLLVSPN